MKVAEIMTRSPNCCVPSLSARMAAGLLAHFQVGFLPVVDEYASRRLLGVITDRDLCVRVLATRNNPDEVAVWDSMTRDVVCCTENTDVQQVLNLMVGGCVRRLPVVDDENRLLGIISIDDLVRNNAVSSREICSALMSIMVSTPRAHVTTTGV